MVTHVKDFNASTDPGGMSTYIRNTDTHLTTLTRILGVCTAIGEYIWRASCVRHKILLWLMTGILDMFTCLPLLFNFVKGALSLTIVCGVGADVAYHRHVMGLYVTAASGLIFFLEITWAITLFVQICVRNDESLCSCCWSGALAITRGWRRALFYLPLSCILAWKPHSLWLSYVAAGLLAVLSLLHIASSALGSRVSCQMSNATDSVGESLLNTRPENYDRFEEVLTWYKVTEVLDDGVSGPTGRMGDSDGEI